MTHTKDKQESQYTRSLIELSLDPMITISTEGKITDMNEAFANLADIKREKLTNTNFGDYFTEPLKAREVYQKVFEKGFVKNFPLTIMDGKLTNMIFDGSVYKNEKGNVLGAIVAGRDFDEQKWAVELRIANKELAFQNDEKEKLTAELIVARQELAFQKEEKKKRADELGIANIELAFQDEEKEKHIAELGIANKELVFRKRK